MTPVSDADLDALVAAYDLGGRRASKGIPAGTVNTSYALDLEKGRYFLRIYEEQDDHGARREAALLAHLAAHGVPTPAPVAARDGAFVRTIATKPAALFPWVEGDMRCQRSVTPDDAFRVGAALARVHLVGPPPGASVDPGRFGPDALVVRCDRVTPIEGAVVAAALRAGVEASAEARRRRGPIPSGLVHGDLFRDNVLWAGHSLVLLDFESAHHGPFAYDIAVTIHSWAYGSRFDFAIARAIVDGYRSVRELAAIEREALYDEAVLAALRFTITRITDDAIRVGKKWQRFVERREGLEALGPDGLARVVFG